MPCGEKSGPRGTVPANYPPTMIRKDYVPKDESAQLTWAENLNNQCSVTANQTAMGWNSTEASHMCSAAGAISGAVMNKETARSTYLSAVAAGDTEIARALAVIRPLVGSGKDSALYTTAWASFSASSVRRWISIRRLTRRSCAM